MAQTENLEHEEESLYEEIKQEYKDELEKYNNLGPAKPMNELTK
jgi:hypothetical protein